MYPCIYHDKPPALCCHVDFIIPAGTPYVNVAASLFIMDWLRGTALTAARVSALRKGRRIPVNINETVTEQ